MRNFVSTWLIFPIWSYLTRMMGYNFCLWMPPGADTVKVIHLYDHEFNLVQSMRQYLED